MRGRGTGPVVSTPVVVVVLLALPGVACDRIPGGESHREAPTADPGSTATPTASATATQGNDGTDPRAPVLSPDDANFVDARKGAGWGDRCFNEIKQGKWGWAHAACDRALALPDVDPKARPLLLYNEGLIAKHAGDSAAARSYFEQSLALRAPTDPGRATVEKELVNVGGQVQSKTFSCNGVRCRDPQICCPGGPAGTGTCIDYDPSSPNFCRLVWRGCDPETNEPCVSPQRCKPGPPGPQQNNLMCAP